FELPYCSRCPAVVVDAVNRAVGIAQSNDLLQDRIAKQFMCFLPTKRGDSERYPTITHARCTVESIRAPYMARFIEKQIREIPPEDIADSVKGEYPTAMVIGPGYFIEPIYRYLHER